MAYDYTMVPAGFQDLIPNNDQNKQQNAQNVADNVQNTENNAQNVPVVAQSQPDDFYLNVFGGARAAEENFAETQKYAETEAPIVADKIKKGNIYRKYLATQPEVLAQAKEMAGRLQIPVESITRSTEDFEAAVKMDNRYKKLLSISPTDEKQFTLDELYSEYPELLKLKSDTDGAIALHNIENVKLIKGVTEAAEKGWESRKLQREYSSIALAAYEGKELTEADKKRLADIRVAQNQMLRYAPEFLDNPMAAISYGTVEQGAMMGEQTAKTQVYAIPLAALVGTGVTAVSGPVAGAAAAKTTWATATKWGTGVEMFKETVGGYYLDYKEYVDKNGKQLLSDNEARVAATLAAAGEAYLEVANFDKVLDMLKGTPAKEEAKEIIGGIVANAADKASFKAQLAYYMKNRFGKAVAAGWSEIKEEGEQAVYTDMVHNLVAAYKPNGNLKMMSASEIAEDAWDNMWQAVPSVVGMTGAGHVASGSMYVNKLADWLSAKHEDVLAAQRTAGGINMIEQLAADIKNSDMAKNSRDVYDQLVTNSVEGTQYQNVIVDTALLLEDDSNGENSQVFYQLAAAKGLEQSQADELKGTKMSIPIAQYLNVVEDEAVREKLRTLISFTEKDDCFARIQDNAKRFRKEFDQRVAADYEKVASSIENWVKANIQGEEEQAMMTQVLFEYMDPKEGVKEIKKQYQEELDGLLKNTLDNMRSGMKQGVTFLFTDDDGNAVGYGQGIDVHIGGATRISNNDRWYSEYYKENKKAPSEKEMKRIAREALMGNNPYGIVTDTFGLTGADLAEAEQQYKERFETIDSVLETLGKLEPAVENMDVSELKAMDGLTVDGIKAFNTVKEALLSKNGDVKKSAAASAIVVAHHADIWAGYMRNLGVKVTEQKDGKTIVRDYVAMDYVKKRLGLGTENKADTGIQYNQQQAVHIGTELMIQRPIKENVDAYNELNKMEFIDGVFDELKNKDIDEQRDIAKAKFNELYKVNNAPVRLTNRYNESIRIITGAFKEIKKKSANTDILCLVPHVQELLDNCVFLYETLPNPSRIKHMNQTVERYFTYGGKIRIGDNEYYVKYVTRREKGNIVSLHDMDINKITEAKSKDSGSADYDSASESKDLAPVKYSIPWWRKEVKEKLLGNTVLQQRAADPEKTLVAYHNITGQELMRALDFGGFPVPSLAVMKKDVAYDKYGEITLVGTKDMVDPSRGVPVYAKDGYTITFPKPSYAVPKIATVRKFKDKWKNFFYGIDDAYSIDRIVDEYRSPESMADNLRNSFGFQYYYLTKVLGKNVEIPENKYVPRMPILKNESYFKKLYDLVENVDKYDDLDIWLKDIGAAVEAFYDERIAKAKLQVIKKKLIELKAETVVDGVVNNNELNKIFKELEEYKKAKARPGKDYRALKSKVRTEYNDIVYGNEYYKWADEQIKELVGEGKVKIGNKLYPFTLENVTRYMVKNAGAGAEASFTFSAGKVSAVAAQKFKSIDEMHKAEGKLGTEDEFNKSADMAKEIGNEYRDKTSKYQKNPSDGIFTAFDDAMESLAKASDNKGYTTIEKLRAALKKNGGFTDDIPDNVLQLGVDYLKALTDTTTQYFEAKPQRAIDIGEFAGAVVPSNADPALVKRLQDAGLQIETYPAKDSVARQAATQRIQNGNDNVLFQAAGQKALTANLPNLENAMAAYEAGKSAGDIYRETGWHIGMDGKWRFEIPDNLDLIDASKFPTANNGVRLEDIYPNKALYEAYPWLADILVVGKKLEDKTYGYADSKNGIIAFNTKFIGNKTSYTIKFGNRTYTKQEVNGEAETYIDDNGKPMPLVVSKALEVLNSNKALDNQNYVANSIVGLEHILERKEDAYEYAVKRGADQERIFQLWESKEETKGILDYIKSLGSDFKYEMEVFTERDDAYTHKNLDGTLIHEIQHLIQDKEGFAVGGNPEAVQKQIVRQKEKTLEAMKNIHPNAWDVYIYFEETVQAFSEMNFNKMDQAQKDYDRIVKHYGLSKDETDRIVKLGDAYKKLEEQEKEKDNTVKYFHLHGEQEARLASSKAELATQIAEGKDNFENGYDNILKEWSKDKSEELKAKGERLAELEKAANDIDDSAEWTDAMEEEYEELSSMDELLDLADELSNQSLQNFRYLGLLDKYEREVLSTIDFNNTIVVFGGGAVAASTINPNATKIQAQVDVKATGEHIITLFESADQSTFMHEMAHVFYDDLRDLAVVENAPEQVKRDWNNLKMWTAWKDGQLEEYKGTATYNGFKELDAAIRQAQETGSGTYMNQEWSLQSLLNRWEQERFARGFEVYLEEGKAPTKALRGAFSKFKAWLTKIYKAVTGAGAKPSDQVRKVMDRMIATQEEIDNAMEEASLDALEKKGLFKYLSGTSQDMWTKNLAEIKEDVSAKVLKIAMKDMTAKAKEDRAEQIKAEREAAYERISQEPVFVAYQYLKQNPNLSVSDVVETMTDMSVEEYAAELKARGGSLEGAVNQYMETYEAELKEPSKKEIRAAAEQAISESHYTKLALAFEIQALEKFVLEEEALARKLDAINKQEKQDAEANDKAQRLLNYIERKQGKEHRIYRDSLEGYVQKIEKYAEQKMAGMAISEATNPAMWKKMAEENADDSLDSFAKVEYGLATKQKRIAFFYHTMAELAEKNKKVVDSRVKTLMAHTKTMMKEKNVSANDRYLYNHLMYCFGLANKDAIKPPGYPASYMDVLLTYNENLEISYVDEDGNIDLPDWLTTAMSAESGTYKYKDGYTSLRMDELQLLYNVMENIYKAGRDAKTLKTTRDAQGNVLTVDEVVGDIIGQAMDNVALLEEKDPTGMESENWWEATKRKANEAHVSLLKAETILRQLGDKAVKYIYNPIKVAADNEMVETEILTRNIRGITEAYHDSLVEMYSNQGVKNPEAEANKAMKELRTKKLYRIGTSNLTKEELICVALNWGTDINRKRVLEGHDVSQSQVEKALANLNSADWQMIMNIWKLFDEYWPRLVEVEANISGVVLEKQEAVPFSIMDNTGFAYNLPGGYYPIKYDRHKNKNVGNQASDEAVRAQLSGATRLGMGLGNTKERMETVKYKLRLDFGVFQESLGDTIHNICMREAVRDVYRVIRDKNFNDFIVSAYGNATANMLENWALDCWKKEPQVKGTMETVARWVREKQTVASLGFRTTTALLNICNISYVFDYLGAIRAVDALKTFYAHPREQFDFAMEKSVFLRDRAETMDRDMGDVLKRQKQNPGEGYVEAIQSASFKFITATDLMLACPMWISEYQRVYQESMDKKLSPEHAEREAVLAGDAAVRRVFGSGQIQDQAKVQKGNEFEKIFTMYYSFFSVVHNALMMKVFESRQAYKKSAKPVFNEDGTIKGMERDYKEAAKALVPIAEGVLYWMIIPAAMEACIRSLGSGDDKDKEAKNLAKKTFATTVGSAVGGIPLLREAVPAYLEWVMGGRYYGVSGNPIGDVADQVQRVMSGIKSGKKPKLDVARDTATVISSVFGLPKTMLDAMITAAQFIDHGKLTVDDIRHYLWAVMYDKNPDKKK